jgi:hypothetical protein
MAKRTSAGSGMKLPTKADAVKFRAQVDKILDECEVEVRAGLGSKTFQPAAERGLRAHYRPKILRRLVNGGVWEREKKKPKIVAKHLGQICAILSKGRTVSATVALAAAAAARQDEVCPRSGGTGDWCF